MSRYCCLMAAEFYFTNSAKGTVDGKPLEFADNDMPPLEVRLIDHNRAEHLENVVSCYVRMSAGQRADRIQLSTETPERRDRQCSLRS